MYLILNIDADRVETLGVVRTGRCADDGKAVMLGGMNAQAHIGSDAERADVQGRAVRMGHPVAVHIDQRLDSLDEVLRRDGGMPRRSAESLKRFALQSGRNSWILPSAVR